MKNNAQQWQRLELASSLPGMRHNIFAYGPPGTGKSYAAARTPDGRAPVVVTITPETSAADLVGYYILGSSGTYVWQDGPATRAWREGRRLVVNEIDRIGGDATAVMHSILDEPETAVMHLSNGEIIKPAKGFHCIATSNLEPEDALTTDAMRDRFQIKLKVGSPHPKAIESLDHDCRNAAVGGFGTPGAPSMRQWRSFCELRSQVGDRTAGELVFGENAEAIIDSLAVANS